MIRTSTRVALVTMICASASSAQSLDTSGATDTFSLLYNPRFKTFVRASSDPNDFIVPPSFGNDDGFTGSNQVEAYRTLEGGREVAVLAHLEGRPGFMGSFFRNFWGGLAGIPQLEWENTRAQVLVEDTVLYDLPLYDYFRSPGDPRGQVAPFVGPMTQSRAGGHITFVPTVFEDSLKVRVFDNWFDNAARFYRVSGTLGTWDDVLGVPELEPWENAATLAAGAGSWPHSTPRVVQNAQLMLNANSSQTITLAGPATVLELTCTVQKPGAWDDLRVRITFDGQLTPSVDCPLRVLGAMVRSQFSLPVSTLLMNNDGATRITNYWPMHFASGATIEFINTNPTIARTLNVDYCVASGVHPEPWGYYTVTYDEGITQTGLAFSGPQIADAHGMLRYVGVETSINNVGNIPGNVGLMHLEGDLCIRINGNKGDDHVYAATETSIGHWGWYDSPSDLPFSKDCSFHTGIVSRSLSGKQFESMRMQGSTLVFDPVHFVDGIDIVLEHGPGNQWNADYKFATMMYVAPGAARDTVLELDVGDPVDEATRNAAFVEAAPPYELTHGFFRDTQYLTSAVTDSVRVIGANYTFDVAEPNLTNFDAFAIGVRLDRDRPGDGGISQADVFVDGYWAGLIHGFTSNQYFRWKEGGELEVEIPRALTAGKTQFTVELRPRQGTLDFNLARIWVYGY